MPDDAFSHLGRQVLAMERERERVRESERESSPGLIASGREQRWGCRPQRRGQVCYQSGPMNGNNHSKLFDKGSRYITPSPPGNHRPCQPACLQGMLSNDAGRKKSRTHIAKTKSQHFIQWRRRQEGSRQGVSEFE